MRLVCADHAFPLLAHDAVCDLVAALGFEALDLALMADSHVRPDEVRADVAGCAGRVAERLGRRGLKLADTFVIPAPDPRVMAVNHPDASERERGYAFVRDMLDFTIRAGGRGMTVLPGVEFEGSAHVASLERAASGLARLVDEAGGRGLRLAIEPHVGSIVEDPADAALLLEMTPGLTLALDFAHFVSQGYALADLSALLARTAHVHARGAKPGSLQASMADNAIEWEAVVAALRAAGYDGDLVVEFVWTEWQGCNRVDNLSETVLLRHRLRAALAGRPYVPFGGRR